MLSRGSLDKLEIEAHWVKGEDAQVPFPQKRCKGEAPFQRERRGKRENKAQDTRSEVGLGPRERHRA